VFGGKVEDMLMGRIAQERIDQRSRCPFHKFTASYAAARL
jgi:hypothetical protein